MSETKGVLCLVHQITQLHVIKSPLTAREITLVFSKENCPVPDCRVVRNLKQLLDYDRQINNGPFTFNMASRKVGKAEQVSCIAARRLATTGLFRRRSSEHQQGACTIAYTRGTQSNERKLPLLILL